MLTPLGRFKRQPPIDAMGQKAADLPGQRHEPIDVRDGSDSAPSADPWVRLVHARKLTLRAVTLDGEFVPQAAVSCRWRGAGAEVCIAEKADIGPIS